MTDPIEQVVSSFTSDRAKMFNSEGKPIFTPEEHTARLGALQQRLQISVDQVVSEGQQCIAKLKEEILVLESRSPIDALAPAELQRANERREFIKEDIASQPINTLAAKLRGLFAKPDTAELFLYARYLPARLEEEQKKKGNSNSVDQQLRELWGLARQAAASLNPAQNERLARINKEIEEQQLRIARAQKAAFDTRPERKIAVRL